jgi:3-oxoadipate enol-lactonase
MRFLVLLILMTVAASADEAVLNGFRMYYEDRGRGEPVVFLHGFSLDSRMWKEQRPLSKQFRLVLQDRRFHGRSEAVSSTPGSAEAAADVIALLDHLKIRAAHLVGHSAGGAVALETALRYPDRVRSLVLVAAGIEGIRMPREAMASFMKGIERMKTEGKKGFVESWLQDPLLKPVADRPEVREMLEAFNIEAMMKIPFRPPSPPTQLDRLGEVKTRTLVQIGEADAPHLVEASESAATKIAGAKKISYPGAGHMLPMEAPQKFNRDLANFLESVAAR